MNAVTLTKEQFKAFVQNLIKNENVIGIQKKENKYAFGPLEDPNDLTLDYDVALTPPKQYILPHFQELLRFKTHPKLKLEVTRDDEPITIIGVHPYDLKAINQLDRFFETSECDDHYQRRRQSTTIIAVTPERASKWSFWSSMDSSFSESGYDLLLTNIGEKFVVEVGTTRGEELLRNFAKTEVATKDELHIREQKRLALLTMCAPERKLDPPLKIVPELVESKWQSEVWEKQAEKCYSCGSCVLICPTCICFDVKEEMELNLKEGKRTRVWDSCLLEDFATVAGGENFREHAKERFRHRFFRKMVYLFKKSGEIYCVGCGRCSEVCLPDIADPVQVIGKLKEEK